MSIFSANMFLNVLWHEESENEKKNSLTEGSVGAFCAFLKEQLYSLDGVW